MSSVITQASTFYATHNTLHLRRLSNPHLLRSKVLMMMNYDGHSIKASSFESRSAINYISKSHNDILGKPNSSTVEYVNGDEIDEPVDNVISEKQRSAKIHDFCFGIPYGGIVFSGGLVGFTFSRNPASLMTGGLYGGALLALSILSLKIWRQGQSSSPFILGQAGIARCAPLEEHPNLFTDKEGFTNRIQCRFKLCNAVFLHIRYGVWWKPTSKEAEIFSHI